MKDWKFRHFDVFDIFSKFHFFQFFIDFSEDFSQTCFDPIFPRDSEFRKSIFVMKINIFYQIFFSGKVCSCTFDFWPLREDSSTLSSLVRGSVQNHWICTLSNFFRRGLLVDLKCCDSSDAHGSSGVDEELYLEI